MTGTSEHPYILYLPASCYRDHGSYLGFEYSEEEIREAMSSGGNLGRNRYLPERDAPVQFPIPPGTYVECRISRHVL